MSSCTQCTSVQLSDSDCPGEIFPNPHHDEVVNLYVQRNSIAINVLALLLLAVLSMQVVFPSPSDSSTLDVAGHPADDVVGYVEDMTGSWDRTNAENIKLPQSTAVFNGWTLRPADPHSYIRIHLVDRNLSLEYPTTWRTEKHQATPLDVTHPISVEKVPSFIQSVTSLLGKLFQDPKGALTAISPIRNQPDREIKLSDGLVKLNTTADFSQVIAKVGQGNETFHFSIKPLGCDSTTPGKPLAFESPPAIDFTNVVVPGLEPGRYSLERVDKRQKKPIGDSVVVIVANSPEYEKQRAAFDQFLKLTTAWQADTKTFQFRRFLVAYLLAIQESNLKERNE